MELIVLMVAGFVLVTPVIAIVALVRTGRLRDSLDARFSDLTRRTFDLEAQVVTLHRDLGQMQRLQEASAVAPNPPIPEACPASATVTRPVDQSIALDCRPCLRVTRTWLYQYVGELPELGTKESVRKTLSRPCACASSARRAALPEQIRIQRSARTKRPSGAAQCTRAALGRLRILWPVVCDRREPRSRHVLIPDLPSKPQPLPCVIPVTDVSDDQPHHGVSKEGHNR